MQQDCVPPNLTVVERITWIRAARHDMLPGCPKRDKGATRWAFAMGGVARDVVHHHKLPYA